jgi:hypothetical protein
MQEHAPLQPGTKKSAWLCMKVTSVAVIFRLSPEKSGLSKDERRILVQASSGWHEGLHILLLI